MADEDDGKEYRWETGYEKTWYALFQFLNYGCDGVRIVPTRALFPGKRSKKTTMAYSRVRWQKLFKELKGNVSLKGRGVRGWG